LLMLAITGNERAAAAVALWLEKGKMAFANEVRQRLGLNDALLTPARWSTVLPEALGSVVMHCLETQERHLQIGNVLCVHGGLDPTVPLAVSLAPPWTEIGGTHWASIRQPFLAWRGGFQGLMVVHGHSPPDKHRRLSGYPDPHVFQHDRLSLDGGSALTGVVAAAELEDGRYRLFLAQSPPLANRSAPPGSETL
jgi:serine/threonine protein phosphatase 1